jgi:hypothetical protein
MAQLDFGLRASLLSSSISLEGVSTDITEGDAEIGYQFGVFARVKVLTFYIQPELLFTNSGATVNEIGGGQIDLSYNKIDVPVMIGMKLGPIRVQAGPSFSFLSSAEATDASGAVEDLKDNYNSSTVGYQAGVGIDISKFIFDLKYEESLSNFADTVPGGFDTDQRASQWVIGVGFKLF